MYIINIEKFIINEPRIKLQKFTSIKKNKQSKLLIINGIKIKIFFFKENIYKVTKCRNMKIIVKIIDNEIISKKLIVKFVE